MDKQLRHVDIGKVAAAALDAVERLLMQWAPNGKRRADEWVAANPTRADEKPGSFKINMLTGHWADFATGDKGGDLVSLYRYLFGFASQVEAARDLADVLGVTGDYVAAPPKEKREADWLPILPVPADAPPMHKAHPVRGLPERVAVYRDKVGRLLGAVMRFRTSDGGKDDLPHVYARHRESGRREWRWMAFPLPRPLYGLDLLADNPDWPVLVVEGEKCADVGRELGEALVHPETGLPFVVMAWPGGGKAVGKVDWSALEGRDVVLWPDADSQRVRLSKQEAEAGVLAESKPYLPLTEQPGYQAMQTAAKALDGVASRLSFMAPFAPGEAAEGWDLADAVQADGWTAEQATSYIAARARLLFPVPDSIGSPPALAPADTGVEAPAGCEPINPSIISSALEQLWLRHPDSRPAPAPANTGVGKAWRSQLKKNDEGVLRPILANAYLVLMHHEDWAGVLAYDEFSQKVLKLRPPPYEGGVVGEWEALDASKALVWLQLREGLMLKSSAAVEEAAVTVAKDFRFHSVRQWLRQLPMWDGTARLSSMLARVFGVMEDEFTRYIGAGWLVAAVARVMDPGCKVDEMLVLEGGQGMGKSSAVRELFMGEKWYSEIAERPDDKDFLMAIQGNWCIEIGEMQSFSKAEVNQVKLIVTRRNDKFRPPYERHTSDHPRQCVFVGTTNGDQYLNDPTGARRFLPVLCGKVDLPYLREVREQLWAEALYLYAIGFEWWSYPKDLAAAAQDERFVVDSWEEQIARYLAGRADPACYPSNLLKGPREKVTTTELLKHALGLDNAKHGRGEQTRVGQIMMRLKWPKRRDKPDADGYRPWVFLRPDGQSVQPV